MDSRKFEVVSSGILTIAALAVAASVVYRVFFAPDIAQFGNSSTNAPARRVAEWPDLRKRATPVEGAGGRIVMLEVADFECPACRQFELALQAMKPENRAHLDLGLLHLPLSYHRFAIPSAVAFECAARQGRARQMKEVLYEKQGALGILQWHEMASFAGVQDSTAFAECFESQPDLAKIQSGVELARELDLQGTPTIIVNGWILGHIPTSAQLDSIVEAIVGDEKPALNARR